jgi:hypothetical protein
MREIKTRPAIFADRAERVGKCVMAGNIKPPGKGVKTMLDAALDYGRARLKIFPILEMTKDQPLIKQWGVRASSDTKQITEWWTRWPNANIGLACMPSGLAVIDSDAPNGENTLRDLETFEAKILSPTRTARSPRGGVHRFYRGRIATTVGRIGPNVDTRGVGSGNGGYVLLAPSRTPQGSYAWLPESRPLANVDEWVVEACGSSVDNGPASQVPLVEWDLPGNVERARYYLTNDAPVSKQGAGGDETLVKKVAPTLKDFGISEELAGELMAEIWNGRCEPPWQLGDCADADNLFAKIHNGYIYCRDNPPGSDAAEAQFAADPAPLETDEEMQARLARTAERRKRREQQAAPETWESLKDGWCYIGQQKRYVRKRDGMMWEVAAFSDYYASVTVPDKATSTTIHRWITTRKDGEFQKFDTFCYLPGEGENVGGSFNQYVPSAILPLEGDTTLWDQHLAYLFPVERVRNMVLDWLAWVLKNLDKKPKHALFVRGEIQGTGKSFIGDVFAALIGENNRTPVDQGDFETPHNGWQMRTKLVTCEEVRSLSLPATRKLHGWITQPKLHINEKNMPQVTIPDVIAYLFFSNKADALPIDDSDRRYLIVGTDAKPRGREYYCRLYDLLDDPAALAAIKHQLMTRDIGTYTAAGAAPYTDAKGAMIEASASDLQSYMVEHAGEAPLSYRLVTVDEIIERLPRHVVPRQRVHATLYDILRRRFNGIHVEGQIRPGGRSGDKIRVWAIGPTPEAVAETMNAGSLATIYRDERVANRKNSKPARGDFDDDD